MTQASKESSIEIKALGTQHDRKSFCSGAGELDHYFYKQISQDARNLIAAPFVLVDKDQNKILGYYTLSAIGVDLGELPENIAKKLPKYPVVPATLLARLAIHQDHRGNGYGEHLLIDALFRSLKMSNQIASFAVIVDAKDEKAVGFYMHYEFQLLPDQKSRLFLPMKKIKRFCHDLFKWVSISEAIL